MDRYVVMNRWSQMGRLICYNIKVVEGEKKGEGEDTERDPR